MSVTGKLKLAGVSICISWWEFLVEIRIIGVISDCDVAPNYPASLGIGKRALRRLSRDRLNKCWEEGGRGIPGFRTFF